MKLHCVLHGHDDLFKTDETVAGLYLQCQTCGRATPGWHHTLEVKRSWRCTIERLGAILALAAFQGLVWTGPKLTPQEAADILRPNQYVAPPTPAEPLGEGYVMRDHADPWAAFKLGYLGRRYDDEIRVYRYAGRHDRRANEAAARPARRR